MKLCLILVVLLGTFKPARADVFAFKDLEGYEKCMDLDHLIEKITTDKGSQTRILSQSEIQAKCIEAAVKLLTASKNKDLAREFVKATKRLTAHENALDLISVLVDISIADCNDIEIYEVINKGLSFTKDDRYYLPRARGVAKKCLKDTAYKKDFLEELDNSDKNIAANACQILVEEKVVKSCKASKP